MVFSLVQDSQTTGEAHIKKVAPDESSYKEVHFRILHNRTVPYNLDDLASYCAIHLRDRYYLTDHVVFFDAGEVQGLDD
jgi:hypothetical protein